MEKIAIYCEYDNKTKNVLDVSFELISKAYKLKTRAKELLQNSSNETYSIEAIVIGDIINDKTIKKLYSAGADKVILIENPEFETFDSIAYANAFCEYYQTSNYDCILFPATPKGRMTAPRITTILNTGLVADCTDIDFIIKNNELKLAPTRPTFGSQLMATILSKKNPQCATIRPGVFKAEFNNQKEGEFIRFCVDIKNKADIKILTTFTKEEKEDYFKNADIILCAGFGLSGGKGLYYRKIQQLAKKLNAKAAATRKVVDFNYMPQKTQVGQTGQTVNPRIYIAFGVSGAIQHICGMRNAQTIIAINNDPNAEIFKYSDYRIIADAKKIIDEMLS